MGAEAAMMVGVEAADTVPEPSGYRKGPNRGPFFLATPIDPIQWKTSEG